MGSGVSKDSDVITVDNPATINKRVTFADNGDINQNETGDTPSGETEEQPIPEEVKDQDKDDMLPSQAAKAQGKVKWQDPPLYFNPDKTDDPHETKQDMQRKSSLKITFNDDAAINNSHHWTQYQIEALNAHNQFRYKHQVEALELNTELCQMAQKHADYLAKSKNFEYSRDKNKMYNNTVCGENVAAMGVMDSLARYPGHVAVQQWYDEGRAFKYHKPRAPKSTRDFVQLIWKDTREFGQAKAVWKEGKWTHFIAVAYYYPAAGVSNITDKIKPPRNAFALDNG